MIIVGGGVAGLMAALAASPRPVTVINPGPLGPGAASWLSQGGMAVAIGKDDDITLHIEDTLKAGAGLCDPAAVKRIISAGPRIVEKLLAFGVSFDRTESGELSLGLEAAHSKNRILHGGGDKTGETIMRALIAQVQKSPSINVIQASVGKILTNASGVAGVQILKNGQVMALASSHIVLATGGIGGLFRHSTNPVGAIGHGLILAMQLGAALKDLEFIQFHPTALATSGAPLPLVSEAVRGEGARLIDEQGEYFMRGQDLAARDVVARGVFAHLARGHQVFLDISAFASKFPARFPTIYALCQQAGIDPLTGYIPVQPAAHYHMGGVAVDEHGRTNVPGLYAVGEVACTGLHGANRLASNSLLEAAICGWETGIFAKDQAAGTASVNGAVPWPQQPNADEVRDIMTQDCGVLRSATGLTRAIDKLSKFGANNPAASLSLKIVEAALNRKNSVGAHMRTDIPMPQGS